MVRQMSAAQAAGRRGRGVRAYQPEPTVGTVTREVWDVFQAARGTVITYDLTSKRYSAVLTVLKDFYGLDIRSAGEHRWCLAGELLLDGTYVDYVAQRLALTPPPDPAPEET